MPQVVKAGVEAAADWGHPLKSQRLIPDLEATEATAGMAATAEKAAAVSEDFRSVSTVQASHPLAPTTTLPFQSVPRASAVTIKTRDFKLERMVVLKGTKTASPVVDVTRIR